MLNQKEQIRNSWSRTDLQVAGASAPLACGFARPGLARSPSENSHPCQTGLPIPRSVFPCSLHPPLPGLPAQGTSQVRGTPYTPTPSLAFPSFEQVVASTPFFFWASAHSQCSGNQSFKWIRGAWVASGTSAGPQGARAWDWLGGGAPSRAGQLPDSPVTGTLGMTPCPE